MTRVAASALAAGVLLTGLTGCGPRLPDQLEGRYVEVPVNQPATLTMPTGTGNMWADTDHAQDVTCWASGPDGAPRQQLGGHFTQRKPMQPATWKGREYLPVGELPGGPGKVVVECDGPAATRLHAALYPNPDR